MPIAQLFPLPGSKADSKYDLYLYPPMSAKAVCEGFQGAASRSLRYSHLPCYLGEINPAQRAIALALHSPQTYIGSYKEAFDRFWLGHSDDYAKVMQFAGCEKSQSALSGAIPEIYESLTTNWKAIASDLYQWMHSKPDPRMAGYYAFCIRACFGNVMRLNPKGTHFNVTWHIDKLANACQFSPENWIEALKAKRWNPTVLNCWEKAIAAVPHPESTWLLLDPPYCCAEDAKMTPCYGFDHQVTTQTGMEQVFNLAIDSLKAGLERGFTSIDVCNYYSPALDSAIADLVASAGYTITAHLMGECNALGNSNGRRVHGQRVDKRTRPVEVIYRISQIKQQQWNGFKGGATKPEQLSLLEVAA